MEKIIGILIPSTYVLMLVLEQLFPARELPRIRGWLLKGILFFVMTGVLSSAIPTLLTRAATGHATLRLGGLGTVLDGIVAFLASDIVGYALHRLMHNV